MGRFRQRADESCWGIRGWKMKINWFNSSFPNKWNSYTNFKRIWTASEDTDREMHCEASLQRTSPTAIGGEPIEFFFNVGREAPHKWETTIDGITPEHSTFMNLDRDFWNKELILEEGQEETSFKWLALNPESPGAVPAGKDFSALIT